MKKLLHVTALLLVSTSLGGCFGIKGLLNGLNADEAVEMAQGGTTNGGTAGTGGTTGGTTTGGTTTGGTATAGGTTGGTTTGGTTTGGTATAGGTTGGTTTGGTTTGGTTSGTIVAGNPPLDTTFSETLGEYDSVGAVTNINRTNPGDSAHTLAGVAGGYQTGATALKVAFSGIVDLAPCSEDPTQCEDGDERFSKNPVFKVSRPQAVNAAVAINGTIASLTVDGVTTISNAFKQSNGGVDPDDGLYDTEYNIADGLPGAKYDYDGEINISKVVGIDAFYFFETSKEVSTSNATNGVFKGDSIAGVGGDLAPLNKVKTATFKGKSYGGIEIETAAAGYEGSFVGSSEIFANLTNGKLLATLTADTGIVNEDTHAINFVGAVIQLIGADITGNTFSGGDVTFKDRNGNAIGTFASGDANSAGGFYGTEAEYAAGKIFGVGSGITPDGQTGLIFLSSEFWGVDVAQGGAAAGTGGTTTGGTTGTGTTTGGTTGGTTTGGTTTGGTTGTTTGGTTPSVGVDDFSQVGVVSNVNPTSPGDGFLTFSGPAAGSTSGATALKIAVNYSADIAPCSEDPTRCDDGDTNFAKNFVVKASRPQAVIAAVTTSGNTAGLTVGGSPTIANSFKSSDGGTDPSTGLTDTLYFTNDDPADEAAGVNKDGDIEISKVGGVDEFFFFNTSKTIYTETETSFNAKEDNIYGVGGNLAPTNKVKTATFKGKSYGSLEFNSATAEHDGEFTGSSVIEANLDTKKLSAKLIADNGVVDSSGAGVNGIGTSIELTGADIYGNTFSGGGLSVKDAGGNVIGTFAAGDANSAGGIYGANAEYAAGVLTGAGVGTLEGTTGQLLVDAEFWGRDEAQ